MTAKRRSPFLQAAAVDNTLPIASDAVELWLDDVERRTRWVVRPLLQVFFAVLLHLVWFFKRLPLPQFRAHDFLQTMICWFCKYFVTPEANQLILRHFATESNILNFLRDNCADRQVAPLALYPKNIEQMREHSFVDHDQELFRMMRELGSVDSPAEPHAPKQLNWDNWHDIDIDPEILAQRRWTQVLDFETSHALFMCLFCFLLTAEEYRDAINGFNLDQSIAIRIGRLIGDTTLAEMAYNKYPLYLVGPWNLGQRFLMHGFFTEYLHERLDMLRKSAI